MIDILFFFTLIGMTICDSVNIKIVGVLALIPIILFLYSLYNLELLFFRKGIKKSTVIVIIVDIIVRLFSLGIYYVGFSFFKEHRDNNIFNFACIIVLMIISFILFYIIEHNAQLIEIKKYNKHIEKKCQSILSNDLKILETGYFDSIEEIKLFFIKKLSFVTYTMVSLYCLVIVGMGIMIMFNTKLYSGFLVLYITLIGIELMLHRLLCKGTEFHNSATSIIGELAIIIGSIVIVMQNVVFGKKGIYIFNAVVGVLILSLELIIIKKISSWCSKQVSEINNNIPSK